MTDQAVTDQIESAAAESRRLAGFAAVCADPIKPTSLWRPMATAPQDGTVILLRVPFHQFQNPVVQFSADCGFWDKASVWDAGYWHLRGWSRFNEPTHWQPMPSTDL